MTRLGSLILFSPGATNIFSTKFAKGILPRTELLIRSEALDRRPACSVGISSPGYPLLNSIELAIGPCTSLLSVGDM